MQGAFLAGRGSPRLRGIAEHLERARFLVSLAQDQGDHRAKFRLLLSAVYSCRAFTELMLEAAEKQEVKRLRNSSSARAELESLVSLELPYYFLIERIRIHDFHRFGIVPPDPNVRETMVGGPMRLTARQGSAGLMVTPKGPQTATSGNASVRLQRPLVVQDGAFFDDDSARFVQLADILRDFLKSAPKVLDEFTNSVA